MGASTGRKRAPGRKFQLKFLGRPWIEVRVAPNHFNIVFIDEGLTTVNAMAKQAVRHIASNVKKHQADPLKVYAVISDTFARMGGIIEVEEAAFWDGADEDGRVVH